MPTSDTGATTASNFAGGSALPLICGGRSLPGEVEAAAAEGGEREHRREGHRDQDDERDLRVPLKHGIPLHELPQSRGLCGTSGETNITRWGERGLGLADPSNGRWQCGRYRFGDVDVELSPPQPPEVVEAVAAALDAARAAAP